MTEVAVKLRNLLGRAHINSCSKWEVEVDCGSLAIIDFGGYHLSVGFRHWVHLESNWSLFQRDVFQL